MNTNQKKIQRTKIFSLIKNKQTGIQVLIKGWVRTRRTSKKFSFVEVNDGSCISNMQIIVDNTIKNADSIDSLTTGSAVSVKGELVESKGGRQAMEIIAEEIELISLAPQSYPLQKKRHSDEFLRTIAHLRPRTNKYGAAFRIRSELSFAVHKFFKERGFIYVHTPVLTGSDCEGAGEMFKVTTLDFTNKEFIKNCSGYNDDFFGKQANLTVSGQLSAEMFALALGDVYTFGPTFRAENSNTSRHVAEFWMIEPEMAFCGLHDNMDIAETFIKYLINHIMENCKEDLDLFAKFVNKTLMQTLDNIISQNFLRIPYNDAVNILSKAKKKFEFEVKAGHDLCSEHERYLTEKHFKKPVIIFDYPKEIKPFYMRVNDDNQTVAAMDILVPGIGEIIGGSQREERLDVLEQRFDETGINKDEYWWYLDSRRFGSVEHSGFGLGFERMLMLVTGISNIRDVIPFPRTPKNIEF